MTKKTLVIDGGFATYQLGSSEYNFEVSVDDYILQHMIWIMDGRNNIRYETATSYKENRKVNQTPEQIEIRERISKYRDIISEKYPYVLKNERLEADDIIAIIAYYHRLWNNTPFYVFGNDKDLLQINGIHLIANNREDYGVHQVTYASLNKKLAKAAMPMKQELDVVLYLSLLGDVADNIPRVLPNRAYPMYNQIISSDTAFQDAYRIFGSSFYNNVVNTILPHPYVYRLDVLSKELNYFMEILDAQRNSKTFVYLDDVGIKESYAEYARKFQDMQEHITRQEKSLSVWDKLLLEMSQVDYLKSLMEYMDSQ